MACLTPMIQMNQGNTRSATVRPNPQIYFTLPDVDEIWPSF